MSSKTSGARTSRRNVVAGMALASCAAAGTKAAAEDNGPGEADDAVAILAISNVIARAMFAFDRKDGEAFNACFASDGEFRIDVRPNPHVLRGADLRNIFSEAERVAGGSADRRFVFTRQGLKLSVGENRHLVTSSFIERSESNRARHLAYWFWALPGEGGAPVSITEMGNYQDELVRVGGKWLFSKRTIAFGPLNPG